MTTNIETKITAYEIDGNEVVVSAHWSNNEMVVLKVQGKSVTVAADELVRAVKNATNH